MTLTVKRLLFWTPRILCILFALFISIFAFDVFDEGLGLWKTILALLIHLVPTWLVLVALAISWRWEWLGTILFTGLGVIYIVWAWGKFPISNYFIMAWPLFLVAILFAVNWRYHRELRER